MITLGTTTISKIKTQSDMDIFVSRLGLKSDTVIIKPNWIDAEKNDHTDGRVLDMFLTSMIGKKIYIVESYTFWRNQKFCEGKGDTFSSTEANFETGKQHWDFFKTADNWFFKSEGLDVVLAKHNAVYINITNELWSGNESIIPLIPQVLYVLKGSDFISFAKLKGDSDFGASLSIKNIFGLYPDPHRMKKYHGDGDKKIEQSILEINKIYRSLFNCYFIVEGVFTLCSTNWVTKTVDKIDNSGIIVGGQDAIQVDDTTLKVIGREFIGPLKNLLSDYRKLFGGKFQDQSIPKDYQIDFPKL